MESKTTSSDILVGRFLGNSWRGVLLWEGAYSDHSFEKFAVEKCRISIDAKIRNIRGDNNHVIETYIFLEVDLTHPCRKYLKWVNISSLYRAEEEVSIAFSHFYIPLSKMSLQPSSKWSKTFDQTSPKKNSRAENMRTKKHQTRELPPCKLGCSISSFLFLPLPCSLIHDRIR